MKSVVLIVCHKKYDTPQLTPYKTIGVGPHTDSFDCDYTDNIGDNIAIKNQNYCELTAHYWAWKHISNEYDIVGLCHYRRYFADSKFNRFGYLNEKSIEKYLKKADIILPEKWYWNVSVEEYYYRHGNGRREDLRTTGDVLKEFYPAYVDLYANLLKSNSASYCNMFVMKSSDFRRYSTWLFKVLSEVEVRTDISSYTPGEARVFGYLSELLLNVWVYKNMKKIKYLPMINTAKSKEKMLKDDIKTILSRRGLHV